MANTKITSRVLADNAVLTANITDANVTTAKVADNAVTGDKVADDVALAGNPTTTTQSAGNNTTRIATTAFVTTAVANLADSAPDALNTLNELAAAMGDDANFSTTITNSIAAKLPLAGGTLTGALTGTTGAFVKASSGGSATSNTVLTIEDDDNTEISILGGSSSVLAINFGHSGDNDEGKITFNTTAGSEDLQIVSSKLITLDSSYVIVQGQSSYAQIALVGNDGVADGYVYAESGDVGFLDGDGNWAYKHDTDTSHQFLINNGEKMRINSNGRLLQFTTVNLEPGDTPTDANCNVIGPGYMFLNRDDTASVDQITFGKNGSVAGRITTTSSTTYTTTSDYRKKENVTPVVNGLERVQKLNPVSYTWIDDEVKVVEEGFLAHEVQEAGWETGVGGEKDGEDVQSMDYGRITPLLVKAIQEQQEQIEQLKTEIQTLKGE